MLVVGSDLVLTVRCCYSAGRRHGAKNLQQSYAWKDVRLRNGLCLELGFFVLVWALFGPIRPSALKQAGLGF